jgi:predicted PolB exonuclease-like 3'-5' exonuclease
MRYLCLDVETVAIPDVETYIEPVSAPSNYKDPEKIAQYILEARNAAAVKASLDVDLARIVALGYRREDGSIDVLRCPDEREERFALGVLWEQHRRHPGAKWLTYNGLEFDLPLVLRRSLYLEIPAPEIQVDKYRHPQVLDLMSILSMQGKLRWHSMGFYAARFGLPVEPDITGAEIAERFLAGDWDAIEKHCRYDVETTWRLAQRIGVVPSVTEKTNAVLMDHRRLSEELPL